MNNQKTTNHEKISRIEALKKIGNYGKYSALTAIGTYMLLIRLPPAKPSRYNPRHTRGRHFIKKQLQTSKQTNTFV